MADVFISYAWTSDAHREWIRLLAINLKAVGYDVLIDADVDYGDDLTGFMRKMVESRHILMVIDENYVDRADNLPLSGVGIENKHIEEEYSSKPSNWLSIIFRDNPGLHIPKWFGDINPKGHNFNFIDDKGPGSEQVIDLWRWIEDLPANRDHSTPIETLRKRAARLESIDLSRHKAHWSNPSIEDEVYFEYGNSPSKRFDLGIGEFAFTLNVSDCSINSIYIYNDFIHAVGINRESTNSIDSLGRQLTPGRVIKPSVGDQVILQNSNGALCLIDLLDIYMFQNKPPYKPSSVKFRYKILTDS